MNRLVLVGLAGFALCWIVTRAAVQSITIDEADSFMLFARGDWLTAVFPSSGNHVLNTLLSRWSASAFGLSELAVRAPAIVGALLYITACYSVCMVVSNRLVLQAPLFIGLVYNPFVMDYLTAGRGYSLALGFLMTAITIAAKSMAVDQKGSLLKFGIASACVGLSFTANFSFAFVNAAVIALFFAWAVAHRVQGSRLVPLIAVFFVPGLVIAGSICGYTLWHWPPGQLFAGAISLSEMCHSIVADSFDHLNPFFVHNEYRAWLEDGKAALASVAVLMIPMLALALDGRRRTFFNFIAGVVVTALVLHWAAFETTHLPLPKSRTAVFLAPLIMLLFGTALAANKKDFAGVTGSVLLVLTSTYFLGCLRLGYFKEWRYNADSRQIYRVLQAVNQRCGVTKPVTAWFYVGALNFYRARFGDEKLETFQAAIPPFDQNQRAYVLYQPNSKAFLRDQGLRVIYYNAETNAVVAVRDCESPATSPSGAF